VTQRLIALALCIAIPARAQDGGTPDCELTAPERLLPKSVVLEHGRLVRPDGGVVDVVRGCWTRTDVCCAAGRMHLQCADENARLEEAVVNPGEGTLVPLVAIATAFAAAAFAAGYAFAKTHK